MPASDCSHDTILNCNCDYYIHRGRLEDKLLDWALQPHTGGARGDYLRVIEGPPKSGKTCLLCQMFCKLQGAITQDVSGVHIIPVYWDIAKTFKGFDYDQKQFVTWVEGDLLAAINGYLGRLHPAKPPIHWKLPGVWVNLDPLYGVIPAPPPFLFVILLDHFSDFPAPIRRGIGEKLNRLFNKKVYFLVALRESNLPRGSAISDPTGIKGGSVECISLEDELEAPKKKFYQDILDRVADQYGVDPKLLKTWQRKITHFQWDLPGLSYGLLEKCVDHRESKTRLSPITAQVIKELIIEQLITDHVGFDYFDALCKIVKGSREEIIGDPPRQMDVIDRADIMEILEITTSQFLSDPRWIYIKEQLQVLTYHTKISFFILPAFANLMKDYLALSRSKGEKK